MKLRLIAVGQRMPGWVQAGFDEYARRLPPHLVPELTEVAPGQRTARGDDRRAIVREGEAIRGRLRHEHLVVLDERGRAWSTRDLATRLADWQQGGRDVALVIGGPDGLDEDLRGRADDRWSLGPLTLPHPLVRVILAEQLYRAWTILTGHPYHRA